MSLVRSQTNQNFSISKLRRVVLGKPVTVKNKFKCFVYVKFVHFIINFNYDIQKSHEGNTFLNSKTYKIYLAPLPQLKIKTLEIWPLLMINIKYFTLYLSFLLHTPLRTHSSRFYLFHSTHVASNSQQSKLHGKNSVPTSASPLSLSCSGLWF